MQFALSVIDCNGKPTVLQWFNEQSYHNMVNGANPMDLFCLCNFAGAVDKRTGKAALTTIALTISDKQWMFREFGAPRYDGRKQRGMQRFLRRARLRWAQCKLEACSELSRIEEWQSCMTDLEEHFNKVKRKSK